MRSARTRTTLYWGIFLSVSMLYSLFVFPHWLDDYSVETLKRYALTPGQTLHTAYLPIDSASYLESANASWGTIARSANIFENFNAGLGSNVLVVVVGKLAHLICPQRPLIAIAIFNHLLFFWSMRNLAAICRRYGVEFTRFLPFVMVNPLVLFSLHTLNKEIIGLALTAAAVRASLGGHRVPLLAIMLLGFFTRNVFFAFSALLLIRRTLFRLPFWAPLAGASLALPVLLYATGNAPFGDQFGDLDTLTKFYSQQTAAIMHIAFTLMKLPLGYILAYPLVAAVNLVSPAFNPRYWSDYVDYVNLAQFCLQASAVAFGALLVTAVVRARSLLLVQLEPFRLVFLFTLLTSALPFSQHRYLLPIYPFVVLLALTARRQARPPALLAGTPLCGHVRDRRRP